MSEHPIVDPNDFELRLKLFNSYTFFWKNNGDGVTDPGIVLHKKTVYKTDLHTGKKKSRTTIFRVVSYKIIFVNFCPTHKLAHGRLSSTRTHRLHFVSYKCKGQTNTQFWRVH